MTDIQPHKFAGVFLITDDSRTSLATKSLIHGQSVYGEKLIQQGGEEYRLWSPRRSKLAAAIQKEMTSMPIQPGSRVLYLGASSGTTVSHVSDIIGERGIVYAVEFSPRVGRELVRLAETRTNIIPIIADARHPEHYMSLVLGSIDVVYQDVAQPDQARIFIENIRHFSSLGCWGLFAIKARSIDSTTSVEDIYKNEIALLSEHGVQVIETTDLDPLEKDHVMVLCRVSEAFE